MVMLLMGALVGALLVFLYHRFVKA